jgi:hypothetical protein
VGTAGDGRAPHSTRRTDCRITSRVLSTRWSSTATRSSTSLQRAATRELAGWVRPE